MKQDRIETRHKRVNLADAIPLPAPFTVRVDPCGACNFKCVFCPCNQTDYLAKERHQRMSWDTFQNVLNSMKEWAEIDAKERPGQELSLKVVDFHGFGEPLLNPLLPEMIRAVKEAKVCREVRLVTNGSLLVPELSRKLIDAGLDLCRVSIYALDAEDYRKLCGVKIDTGRIIDNIASFHSLSEGSGSRISAKIVSTALQTEAEVQRFHQTYDPITDFAFVEEIGEIWPNYDIKDSNSSSHVAGDAKAFDSVENRCICAMAFTDMQIHSDGTVSPCSVDWARELSSGNVNEQSLNRLWHGEKLRELWLKLLDRSAYTDCICKDCFAATADRIDAEAQRIAERIVRQSSAFNPEQNV